MRIALPLIVLSVAAGAAADTPPVVAHDAQRVCRDRIQQVRAASGLPQLDRDNATGEKPLLIAAVDKRIGGCSMMVMRSNLADVRPVPTVPDGPAKLRPLR